MTPAADWSSAAGTARVYDDAARGWRHFADPVCTYAAHTPGAVAETLQAVERAVRERGLWAVGFVTYEAAPVFDPAFRVRDVPADLPLVWFGLYASAAPVAEPSAVPDHQRQNLAWTPTVDRAAFGRAIGQIKRHIAAGDTYQVNYTFRLRAPFAGDAVALFRQMVSGRTPGFSACLDLGRWAICSASPELFVTRTGDTWLSRPMKGTIGRGLWPADDQAKADWLRASVKNQAENVMIVDMVRNDMGRLAVPGSVVVTRLFDVERHPTVWQLTSTVQCQAPCSIYAALQALFPPASITGAPKIRTMELIAELETTPRRIYTGALGFVTPDGRLQFNVAIRTVLIDRQVGCAEYGVGGGIVWDSEAGEEHEECVAKARVLSARQPAFQLLETLRWTPAEGYVLLDAHLRRLAASAAYFAFAVDSVAVRQALLAQAAGFPAVPMRVGLRVAADGAPTITVQPLTDLPQPYRVGLATAPIDSSDRFLYHKTTARQAYENAVRACPGFADVLLWNARGEITESTIANVVVDLDGRLVTPPVSCGLLAGTQREALLGAGEIAEQVIRREDLDRCRAVYLVNSVRGMWRVNLGGEQAFRSQA